MKKINIIILSLTLIILILTGYIIFQMTKPTLTASAIEDLSEYSFTKAICNETNLCRDYLITCKNNVAVEIKAIPNSSISIPDNWTDPRDEKTVNGICN